MISLHGDGLQQRQSICKMKKKKNSVSEKSISSIVVHSLGTPLTRRIIYFIISYVQLSALQSHIYPEGSRNVSIITIITFEMQDNVVPIPRFLKYINWKYSLSLTLSAYHRCRPLLQKNELIITNTNVVSVRATVTAILYTSFAKVVGYVYTNDISI